MAQDPGSSSPSRGGGDDGQQRPGERASALLLSFHGATERAMPVCLRLGVATCHGGVKDRIAPARATAGPEGSALQPQLINHHQNL